MLQKKVLVSIGKETLPLVEPMKETQKEGVLTSEEVLTIKNMIPPLGSGYL